MAIDTKINVPSAEYYTVKIGLNKTVQIEAKGDGSEPLIDVLSKAAKMVNSSIVIGSKENGQLTVDGQVFDLSGSQPRLIDDPVVETAVAGGKYIANTRQSNGE